ncbi:MAG: T9SS type A sorting domain-containing protein [Bacteroidota bacterium]
MQRFLLFAIYLCLNATFVLAQEQLTELNADYNAHSEILDFYEYQGDLYIINGEVLPSEGYGLLNKVNLADGSWERLDDDEEMLREGGGYYPGRGGFFPVDNELFTHVKNASGVHLYRIVNGMAEKLTILNGFVVSDFVSFQGRYYFLAAGGSAGNGYLKLELWETDGSPSGTTQLEVLPIFTQQTLITNLTAGDERLYISGRNTEGRMLIYHTDLSLDGLQPIRLNDQEFLLFPTSRPSNRRYTTFFDGYFYFDGAPCCPGFPSSKLYRYHEATGETSILFNLFGSNSNGTLTSYLQLGSSLFIQAYLPGGDLLQIYKIEAGTPNTSDLVLSMDGQGYFSELAAAADQIFFMGPPHTTEFASSLYQLDYSTNETVPLLGLYGIVFGSDNQVSITVDTRAIYLGLLHRGVHVYNRTTEVVTTYLDDGYTANSIEPIKVTGGNTFFLTGDYPWLSELSRKELYRFSEVSLQPELILDWGQNDQYGVSSIPALTNGLIYQFGNMDIVRPEEAWVYNIENDETQLINLTSDSIFSFYNMYGPAGDRVLFLTQGQLAPNYGGPISWMLGPEGITPAIAINEHGDSIFLQLSYVFSTSRSDVQLWREAVNFSGGRGIYLLGFEEGLVKLDTLHFDQTNFNSVGSGYDSLFAILPSSGPLLASIYSLEEGLQYTIPRTEESERLLQFDQSTAYSVSQDVNGFERILHYYDNVTGLHVEVEMPDHLNLDRRPSFYLPFSDRTYLIEDMLVFIGSSTSTGYEFFVFDPQQSTVEILKDVYPGLPSGIADQFYQVDDLLYFMGIDPEHGAELWRTDGTPEGTYLVEDIYPGPSYGRPGNFYAFDDFLVFSAEDPEGEEVYRMRLDGSEEVALITDINPGAGSSSPRNFTASEEALYFTARPADDAPYQLFRLSFGLLPVRDEIQATLAPTVFPNPAYEQITIEAPEGEQLAELQLYDSQGRQLRNVSTVAERLQLNTADLPPSTYWLVTRYASGAVSRQAVIKGGK